jgi:hypothetical protein
MAAAAVCLRLHQSPNDALGETDELHEPLFQTVGTFLKALSYWRDFAKKRK